MKCFKMGFSVLALSSLVMGCTAGFTSVKNSKNSSASAQPSSTPVTSPTDSGSSSGSSSSTSPNYPRLGAYYIGGPQRYDSTFQSFAAKLNVVVIGGNWQGWNPGYSKEQVISSIHSQSTVSTKVFQYVDSNEEYLPGGQSGDPTLQKKIISMNWWTRNPFPNGSIVESTFSSSMGLIDMIMNSATPLDPSTGLGPEGWSAMYYNDYYHLGDYSKYGAPAVAAAPSLDGFYLDNVFWQPRADGDWERNGSTQSYKNSTVDYDFRAGEKTFFDEMRKIFPTGTFIGNVADWGAAYQAGSNVAPLTNVLQGGVLECAFGENFSTETWGGAQLGMDYYESTINALASPKYLIVGHDRITSSGTDPYSSSPYQAMRYGLAFTLMNDGYYFANNGGYADSSNNYFWFDEYDGGGIGEGYLGQPRSTSAGAAQTGAWQNGVWKREFQNGIVLWNPKGNGAHTVSLAGLGNLKHLCGKQDPSVNNCQSVTNGSVTLQDRDGLILIRY